MDRNKITSMLTSDCVRVGDKIRLKSGGPDMTVERINVMRSAIHPQPIDEDQTTVDCVWFTAHQIDGWSGPFRATFALKLIAAMK